MTARRSRVPVTPDTPREMVAFLDELDRRRLLSIADLASGASTAEIIEKVNALLAELRARGAMES